MANFDSIELKAGKAAYEAIMDGGLKQEMIKLMAGAAGGPKWIVLGHLDRYLFGEWFKDRKQALPMLGSSIGAWRFASSMAFPDPIKGLELFKEGYFGQAYTDKPTREEITAVIPQVTKEYINPNTIPHILNHPFARLFVISVKCKGLLASENKLLQGTGLVATIMGNLMNRKNLNAFFHRVLFHDPREENNFLGKDPFPTTEIKLHKDNFEAALLATGAIPMVMEGIPDVPDAPKGMYRDGGLIDYHLTFPYNLGEGEIVFQPHFFEQVKPSWFDKKLKNRKPSAAEKSHVLLLHPSQKLIDQLPGGYVPDRKDFENYPTKERQDRWEKAFEISKAVGDDFAELVQSGKIREKLKLWD